MQQFISHLHPVLVHLPIGILLIGCLFQWLVVREPYKKLAPAVGITLFWGMITSVFSCISGYLLSLSGDYELETVNRHQYAGITVALLSILLYVLYKKSINLSFSKWLSLLLAAVIVITGHLGGSLTHGAGYLSFSAVSVEGKFQRKPIADVQSAKAYEEVIKPIFQEKCYSCHSSTKQKGKLRLDLPEFIQKGGKEGHTLIPGDPEKSELIKRILLARNEEHHMPPKEKPSLTENEIELLHWWVQSGASFDKAVKDISQPAKIQPILFALQNTNPAGPALPILPERTVKQASEDELKKIRARGIVVMPVAQDSHFLQVNFVNTDSVSDGDIALLLGIKEQLVWLKLSRTAISDSSGSFIGQFTNLIRLQLDNTRWSDNGMHNLKNLTHLQYLNLVQTDVTEKGILQLTGLKNLREVFVYQTKVQPNSWKTLMQSFPNTKIDSGGYRVATLESDTTLVKEKAR